MNNFGFFLRLFSVMFAGLICYSFIISKKDPSKSERVVLHRVIASECTEGMDAYRVNNRVVSKKLIADSLYLTIGFKEHCCPDFDPEIYFKQDTLFIPRLENASSESKCECYCCFEMTLVLTGIKDTSFVVSLKGKSLVQMTDPYKIFPVKYAVIEGDTINRINKYGFREGAWRLYSTDSAYVERITFYKGTEESVVGRNIKSSQTFYPNGQLESHWFGDTLENFYSNGFLESRKIWFNDVYTEESFYPNGNKKSLCYPSDTCRFPMEPDSCQYWNEQGVPINP